MPGAIIDQQLLNNKPLSLVQIQLPAQITYIFARGGLLGLERRGILSLWQNLCNKVMYDDVYWHPK